MQKISLSYRLVQIGGCLALASAGMLFNGSAFADKPSWAGDKGGHKEKHEKHGNDRQRGDRDGHEGSAHERDRAHGHFADRQRTAVREYYRERFHGGHCPPGLAKKHNGCMPPGQARKWAVGRPLPRDVIFYDVPQRLTVEIGLPPAGYRYVRVAGDILMIAAGTGMVIDAIQDLGGL